MSCKIEKMSWRYIINNFGIILDNEDILYNIITNADQEKIKELDKVMKQYFAGERPKDDVIAFFDNNSDIVDKVKYVMLMNANCNMLIEKKTGNSYKGELRLDAPLNTDEQTQAQQLEDLFRRRKATEELLADAYANGERRDFVCGIAIKSEKKVLGIVPLGFLVEYIKSNLEAKQAQQHRRQKIFFSDKDIGIYEMICENPDAILYGLNIDYSTKKALERMSVINITDRENLSDEEIEEIKMQNPEKYCRELSRQLDATISFLDMDVLINLSINTYMNAIDEQDEDPEKQQIMIERLDKIFNIASKLVQKGVSDSKEQIQKFKELKDKYKKRKLDKKYITKNDIPEIIEGLQSGKYELKNLGKEILDMIGSLPNEVFLSSADNLNFAIRNGYLDKTVHDLIAECKICFTDVLVYALSSKMLSKNELIDLYASKCVSLEQIRIIEENLGQLITLDDVMQKYYEEYETQHEQGYFEQEGYESFETLASNVKMLQEPGFENEDVEKAIYDMNSDELEIALLEFYKNYLMDAKTVIESCGIWCIKLLRPVDVKNLYVENNITIEDIEQNVKAMDEEKAIHFICQVFPGKEYSDELNRLIQSLSVEKEEHENNTTGNHRTSIGNTGKSRGKIDVSAIVYKYGFYESLDSECVIDYLPKNGYSIFTLPNVKYRGTEEPCVIVEPMFDKSHKTQRTVAAQDKAMWIIPLSLWRLERTAIVESNGRLNIGRLRELYSQNRDSMSKINHFVESQEKVFNKKQMVSEGEIPKTGWPFRILNLARESKEYSDEELSEISNLAISLEESMIRE